MRFVFLTVFPEMIGDALGYSIPARAARAGMVTIEAVGLRQFGVDSRGSVDDTPYGGGPGLILRVDVAVRALETVDPDRKAVRIMLSPDGELFAQQDAVSLAKARQDLIFLCGRYEGFDARIERYVDKKISVGRYVLSGGELAAMAIADSVIRLLPGALGNDESLSNESCNDDRSDFVQFTRPEIFRGDAVPEVLKSGDHAQIDQWRKRSRRDLSDI